MRKFATCAYKAWNITSIIACVFLVLNVIIIIANIIMRRFFNAPIFGSTELVSYASLITASFALAQNEWFDGNIKMTLLVDLLPKKAAEALRFIDYIVCSLAFIYISYLLIMQANKKWLTADITTDLKMPVFIFAAILAGGFILLTISIIVKTIVYGYALKTGDDINLKRPSGAEEKPLEDA